jgi:hypothetical protein
LLIAIAIALLTANTAAAQATSAVPATAPTGSILDALILFATAIIALTAGLLVRKFTEQR